MDTVEGLRNAALHRPWCAAVATGLLQVGDSPVEHWSETEPEEPEPFGLNELNRRLAALGRETV